MKEVNILVTGASGFIGSHLIASAKNNAIPFIGLSRSKQNSNLTQIKSYLDLDKYIQSDQICVHLAGNHNVKSIDTNEVKILKYLSDIYRSRLIYISSSNVYGKKYKLPIIETNNINIDNDYALRKFDCEKIVLNNLGAVLRLSNVYGPRMSNDIFNHIYNELNKMNGSVYVNNGFNVRDFIHIQDVCSAILLLITNMKSKVYNISTGVGTSIFQLCELFSKNLKIKKNSYKIISDSLDDTMLVLNPTSFSNDFSWKPSIDLDSGIKTWINEYREMKNAE